MKNKDSVKIINFDQLQTLSIKVTQKINDKYLDKFIKTSIKTNNIVITNNTYYYHYFVEKALYYEIIIFEKNYYENIVLSPFLLYGFYIDCDIVNTTDIFLYKDNFIVYQNKKFLFLRNIEYSNKEDIVIFVSQTYQLKIDNIVIIDDQYLQKIEKYYFEKPSKQVIKYNSFIDDNSFKWFKIFILICCILFSYFTYNYFVNKIKPIKQSHNINISNQELLKFKQLNNKFKFKPIAKSIELFKYLKIQHIKLESIKYTNKKVDILLSHNDKGKLLNFLTMYDNKIDIKFIEYKKDTNSYIMKAVVYYDIKK